MREFIICCLAVFCLACNPDPVGDPPGEQTLLLALHPASTVAGLHFQVHGGESAIGVTCRNLGGAARIIFNGVPLKTVRGSDNQFLSASMPPELYAKPGSYPVWIRDSHGDSNRKEFVVKPK